MTNLDEEKKQFLSQVREDYIDMINQQVIYEERARQYRLIFTLAEKYRQGDAKSIAEFIDSEKKNAEKDKNSIKTNLSSLNGAYESINSKKYFIPMLELEYCILTTCNIPDSLLGNISFKDTSFEEDVDFNSGNDSKSNMEKLFNLRFNANVLDEAKKSALNINLITHAHVIVVSLSFFPDNWPAFLDVFKSKYKETENNRYSLLYFLTAWFELRPKHFLKMFPHLIDLIEDCDDGDLLIKHLKIIFDYSKRNMYFRFLPLDSIPSKFKLNYIQTSDYHKIISGTDVTTMQNSFKSNMLKRFDFSSKKFCGETEDNSGKNTAPDTNQNQNQNQNQKNKSKNAKGKPKNTNNNPNTNNNNNNSNENANTNANQKEEYPQQPNLQDFADAIIILMTAVQNSLSLDFFIPNDIKDNNISPQSDAFEKMDKINLQTTKHLKDLFTQSEFNYWKDKIKTIEIGQAGSQKMKAILEGFSNLIVDIMQTKKKDKTTNDATFEQIVKNIQILIEKVKEIDNVIADKFLKINLEEIENIIPDECIGKLRQYQTKSGDSLPVPDCFLTEEQNQFKMEHTIVATKDDKKYKNLLDITSNIFKLLELRPIPKNLHMSKYSYDVSHLDHAKNHNDANQQYVDPWAIRTIFYNFTKYIFDDKYQFDFQV